MARRIDPQAFKRLQKRFRTRRFALVEGMVRDVLSRRDEITILDAGGVAEYWNLLAADLRPRVHVFVLNYAEELRSYDVYTERDLRITNVTGDACAMPQYGDGQFDLAHSNSVIEHVGNYAAMARFAAEMRRVGRTYYVQTPNFWFPLDPHIAVPFLHWLPDPVRALAFSKARVGLAARTDYAGALERLDATRMISRRVMRHLFPDAEHRTERFALLAKSLIAVRG
jgi:2-polyprenyl-3-methyl-5-hydroxy-6-metoxy-1,4-benzoquinol methylase